MQTPVGTSRGPQEILIETPEIENSVTELGRALESPFRRLDPAEKRICEPENTSTEITQLETQRGGEGGEGGRQNRASASRRKTPSGLTYVRLERHRGREGGREVLGGQRPRN